VRPLRCVVGRRRGMELKVDLEAENQVVYILVWKLP